MNKISNYLPEKPKVRFWQILRAFEDDEIFSCRDIIQIFDLTPTDVSRRIARLKNFGLVKQLTPARAPKKPATYIISHWGKRFLNDQRDKHDQILSEMHNE